MEFYEYEGHRGEASWIVGKDTSTNTEGFRGTSSDIHPRSSIQTEHTKQATHREMCLSTPPA